MNKEKLWMDPEGKIYPLEQGKSHEYWALNYLISSKLRNHIHPNELCRNILQRMWSMGWLRLVIVRMPNDNSLVYSNGGKNPSNLQMRAMRDFAIENHLNSVQDDFGYNVQNVNEMIKKSELKILVEEILKEWRGNTPGEWVEPNGTPHDVGSNSHYDWAEEYLKTHGPNRFKDDPREELVARGWAQVVYSCHDLLIMVTVYNRGNSYLTRHQREYLQDQSEETRWKVMDDDCRDIYVPDDCITPTDRNLQNEKCDINRISNNQVYTGKTSFGGYGHGAVSDYSDVPLERDPLNDPRLTGKKPFKESKKIKKLEGVL